MGWTKVSDSTKLESGATYRSVFNIRAPYTTAVINTIKAAINTGAAINAIDAVGGLHQYSNVQSIDALPPLAVAHDPKEKLPWTLIVTYTPKGNAVNNADVGDIMGFIVPILLALAFLIAVTGHYTEKFGKAAVNVIQAGEEAAKHVLNPGVVLALFVVAVVILRRA